jgi:hypothetical protein
VFRDAHFVLDRHGVAEDIWFDLYYGPAVDEHGVVRGVLATVLETTERVRGAQQRQRHEAHLEQANSDLDALRITLEQANRRLSSDMDFLNTLFRQAPSFMVVLTGPEHVYELANDSYLKLVQHRQILGPNSTGKASTNCSTPSTRPASPITAATWRFSSTVGKARGWSAASSISSTSR